MKSMKFLIASVVFAFILSSCSEEAINPELSARKTEFGSNGNGSGGGGKKKKNDTPDSGGETDPGGTGELEFSTFFTIAESVTQDPLYSFSFSQENTHLLLRSEDVGSVGVDYFGFWADPFEATNDQINFTIGLTDWTYTFDLQSDNSYLVTLNFIRRDEFSLEIVENRTDIIGTFR